MLGVERAGRATSGMGVARLWGEGVNAHCKPATGRVFESRDQGGLNGGDAGSSEMGVGAAVSIEGVDGWESKSGGVDDGGGPGDVPVSTDPLLSAGR